MKRCGTREHDAHGHEAVTGFGGFGSDFASEHFERLLFGDNTRQIHLDHRPANDVQSAELVTLDFQRRAHGDQAAATGAGFAHMPALQVARETNPRRFAEHLRHVDVPERPVVVAFLDQVFHRARRIRVVSRAAVQTSVEQPNIEAASDAGRVARHQVFGDLAVGEALAVNNCGMPWNVEGSRGTAREQVDVLGQCQLFGDDRSGVVIARDEHHLDARRAQTGHLTGEEQARAVVTPIAIVEIASDDDEIHVFFEGKAHQVFKGSAGCSPNSVQGRTVVALQSHEGTVEMRVGGVNEAKHGCAKVAGNVLDANDSSLLDLLQRWNFIFNMSLRFEVLEILENHQRANLLRVRDLQTGLEAYLHRYHGDAAEIEAQTELLNTLKELNHPNLEKVLEMGVDDEGLFAVVDLPLGKSLTELLREGPLTEVEFEQLARQLLNGLAVLHERGIAHLSLRPEVVRVHRSAPGVLDVKVAGFGEGFGRKSESEPAEAAAYRCTAPEQWKGDAVGRRTDVYAAGCMFYESLAGKPPFRPDSINGLRAAHLGHDLVPLTKEAPQVRPWISAWVMQLMDPDMTTRPKDASAALKLFNLRDTQQLSVPQPAASYPPGYAPASGAPVSAARTGMVPMTRMVMPANASSTTSAFQPVELAHKTARVIPQPGLRSPQRAAVTQVPLTPTPQVNAKVKPILIGGAIVVVVAAIALLLLTPSKPVMAPVAERLARRVPITNGIVMHLDASRRDRLDTNIASRVKRWGDAEDKLRFAAPPSADNGPTVSPGGLHELPILNFGLYKADQWMAFRQADGKPVSLNNIRTAFWVMRGAGFLLSDEQTTDFHRGAPEGNPDAGIFGAPASPVVRDGKLRLNGANVKTVETPLPLDFSLISLVTKGPAKAGRLCKDRDGRDGCSGGQQIAEVILYDRPLSDDEVKQVETYLRTKWLSP